MRYLSSLYKITSESYSQNENLGKIFWELALGELISELVLIIIKYKQTDNWVEL